jgi:Tfp pilus assembly protein PilN
MINLLPTNERENLMYARRNTKLFRACIAIGIVILVMLFTWGAGYFYLSSTVKSYNKDVEQKRASLQAQKLEETETRIEDFTGSLKLIEQVLSKQILFSELFQQIGAIMPQGTVLSSMEISKVEGGIDLVAKARNYNDGTQVQVNLEDPENKLFSKVDIIAVSCNDAGSTYPCTVTLRALFAPNNPFLFINQSKQDES